MAARFHQLGYDITWLANNAIATDIAHHGKLDLISPQHRSTISDLKVVSTVDEGLRTEPRSPLRWIFFMMPNWALGKAVIEMSQRIPPQACPNLFVMAHGIGSYEKLATFFDPKLILRGVSTQTFAFPTLNRDTREVAHEVIASDGLGGIGLSHHEKADKIAHMLQRAGFQSIQIEARESLEWSDLLWQIQSNALPTLIDVAPKEIYKDPRLFALEYAQLNEAIAVIDRLKIQLIQLPTVHIPRLAWQIRYLPQMVLWRLLSQNQKSPSLRNDLVQKTGRSDAAYLNGAVAQYAYDLGLSAPVNHILALSLTDIAEGRALWGQFRGQVDYLETMIRIASRH